MITSTPLDPRMVEAVQQEIDEGHQLTICKECEGPEIYSRVKAHAKCFRCGAYRQTEQVAKPLVKRRCKRCKQRFETRFEYLTCEGCRGKPITVEEPVPAPKILRKNAEKVM